MQGRFNNFTAKQRCSIVQNNWSSLGHKMAPCSSSSVIQAYRSLKIPNWFDKRRYLNSCYAKILYPIWSGCTSSTKKSANNVFSNQFPDPETCDGVVVKTETKSWTITESIKSKIRWRLSRAWDQSESHTINYDKMWKPSQSRSEISTLA